MQKPDARGYFGAFGGRFVPEVLVGALDELEARDERRRSPTRVLARVPRVLRDFVGRPSPIYRAERLVGRGRRALALQARRPQPHRRAQDQQHRRPGAARASAWARRRIIAETGAGQHGVATATIGAKFGIPVEVFMGARDVERQALNVYIMKLLGATVHAVDGRNADAQGCDQRSVSRLGRPHRRHVLRHRQRRRRASLSVHGARIPEGDRHRGARADARALRPPAERRRGVRRRRQQRDGHLRGLRRRRRTCKLWGVEAAGHGVARDRYGGIDRRRDGRHPARLAFLRAADARRPGARHAFDQRRPRLSRRRARSTRTSRTRAARTYVSATDDEALAAFHDAREREGIVPALETAHAIAFARKLARRARAARDCVLVNLSGRGDKDMRTVARSRRGARARRAGVIAAAGPLGASSRRARDRARARSSVYLVAGDPSGDDRCDDRRARRRRRRPDRTGHSLQRSARRRPDDRRGRAARARRAG